MSAWKHHRDLTLEECSEEAEGLSYLFEECHRTGDGISTKESMRFLGCVERLMIAGREYPTSEYVRVPKLSPCKECGKPTCSFNRECDECFRAAMAKRS